MLLYSNLIPFCIFEQLIYLKYSLLQYKFYHNVNLIENIYIIDLYKNKFYSDKKEFKIYEKT